MSPHHAITQTALHAHAAVPAAAPAERPAAAQPRPQRRRLEQLVALLLVLGAHLALLLWISRGQVPPPSAVEAPALVGTLLAPPEPVLQEPPPVPVLAPPPKPAPPRPQPAVKPPPKAPPSERAPRLPPPPPVAVAAAPEPVVDRVEPVAAASPAAPPAPAADSLPVTPPRADAAHLNNPAPVYPRLSRRLREEGRVLLDVYILPDGSVGEIKLKRSSGFERLDQAALDSVRRWRFVPARRGDEAIAYWYVQPLDFGLDR